jgi:membrane protein implicated in regulation of membrane protease activity
MKLTLAYVVWFGMAAVLTKAVVDAVNGRPWLLIVGVLVFLGMMAKYGCMSHD